MKKLLMMLPLLFFTACTPNYTKHEAHLIVFKTPKTAYADAGFVHHNGEALKVVILVVGQPVFTLELGRKICLDGLCLKKSKWVKEHLSPFYPADILQNIFLGKPIFKGEKFQRIVGGFEQKLFKEGAYDISYKVIGNKMRFKDKIAKILIKKEKISE